MTAAAAPAPEEPVLRRYAELVDRIAGSLRMSGCNPCDAEDALQEAVLKLRKAEKVGETPAKPECWLFRVAVNKGREWCRRGRRCRSLDDEAGFSEWLASADPPVGWESDLAELRLAVQVAIEKLPRDCALVIDLTVDGLSQSEIAAKLACPVHVVRWRLQKAYSHLRKQLLDFRPT